MQQRYRVVSTDTYPEAQAAKIILDEKFPTERFQIRKTHKGFTVVKRVSITEAKENLRKKSENQKGNRRGRSFEFNLQ